MGLFQKLTCMLKGHVPFTALQEPPAKRTKPLDYGFITMGGTGITQGNILWTGANSLHQFGHAMTVKDGALTIENGPIDIKMFVCGRCGEVHWKSFIKVSKIVDSKNLPELSTYYKWRKRHDYEVKQREENEVVRKLYQQYLVALKLTDDASNDANEVR